MKKTTVTVTISCDGHRYGGFESPCHQIIDDGDRERCLAVETEHGLTFMGWDDKTADSELAKTFHGADCARNYLGLWLLKQRRKAEEEKNAANPVVDAEYPEVAPAPAFDPGPPVVIRTGPTAPSDDEFPL